jgi:NAD(P)-dependent dehydrogenase (short-subunit alcohol dehydrogenase family)
MNSIPIKNSVIFVTGANRGIGKALVETALEQGAAKIYAGARRPETLKELVEKGKGRVIALELDITSEAQILKAAERAQDTTILVNNAGISGYSGLVSHYKAEGAQSEMSVNYFGTLNMSLAFAPVLKKNGGGALVNIVSVAAFETFEGFRTYCASKAAEHSLTEGLREELAGQGTSVAGVYPGPVDTDMAADLQMEKETPRQVALNIWKGLESGAEEIWPDPYAVEIGTRLKNASTGLK